MSTPRSPAMTGKRGMPTIWHEKAFFTFQICTDREILQPSPAIWVQGVKHWTGFKGRKTSLIIIQKNYKQPINDLKGIK